MSIPSTCCHHVCRSGPPKDGDRAEVGYIPPCCWPLPHPEVWVHSPCGHYGRAVPPPLQQRAPAGVWIPAWGSPALWSLWWGHTAEWLITTLGHMPPPPHHLWGVHVPRVTRCQSCPQQIEWVLPVLESSLKVKCGRRLGACKAGSCSQAKSTRK